MMIIIKCFLRSLAQCELKWFQDVSVLFWEFKAYFGDRQVNIMNQNDFIIISCLHRAGGGWTGRWRSIQHLNKVTVHLNLSFTSTVWSVSHLDALQGFNLILCFQGRWFVDSVRLHVSSALVQHHADKQQHVLPDDGWGLLKRLFTVRICSGSLSAGATVNGGKIKQGEAREFHMDPLELMWQLFPRSEILCNAPR